MARNQGNIISFSDIFKGNFQNFLHKNPIMWSSFDISLVFELKYEVIYFQVILWTVNKPCFYDTFVYMNSRILRHLLAVLHIYLTRIFNHSAYPDKIFPRLKYNIF